MQLRTSALTPLALSAALAFGLVACDVDDDPDSTTVIEEDDDAPADGGDTIIEEGDYTDVTVEDDADAGTDTGTDTGGETSTDTEG